MSTNPQSHIPFSRWNIRAYVKHTLYSAIRASKLGWIIDSTDSELSTRKAMINSLEEVYHRVDGIIDQLTANGYAESRPFRTNLDGSIEFSRDQFGGMPILDNSFNNDEFVILKSSVRETLRQQYSGHGEI